MYEDPQVAFTVGTEIPLGPVQVSKEEIISFGKEFDPAPFHIDEEAAKASLLGGLSASGFHTCSLAMRMMCDAYMLQSTCEGGAEVEKIEWIAPVRPDDTLLGTCSVVEAKQSRSRPEIMIIKFAIAIYNQKNEQVLSMTNTAFFRRKKSASHG